MFVNPEIPPDELPQAEAIDWQPLDPRFVRSAQIKALIVWAILFAGAGTAHFLVATFGDEAIGPWPFVIGWAVLASFATCTILWPTVSVPRRGYAVRELDLLYKSGVIWQSVKAVPYSRAQHAETNSGPLDRHFGLARLSVFTAGGSGGGLHIVGLARDVAEGLRAHVLDQLGIAVENVSDGTDA